MQDSTPPRAIAINPPAGATVRGQVTESRKSGRSGEDAYIGITFTSVSHDGNSYPIDASTVNVPSKLSN